MATVLSISFPFIAGPTSYPQAAVDDAAIQASIIQIIMTPIGSRIMRPGFGSRLEQFLFEADSASTRSGIETDLRAAISKWEPRVRVTSIKVESQEVTEPGQILITVNYIIIANNKRSAVTVAA